MKGVRQMEAKEEKERQHDERGGWEDSAVAFLMLPMLPSRFKLCPSPVFLPAILSASLTETERQREEQRWARWCRGGTGEISGAQALPVKSDMTFWFCHLSPTAMSDSTLRSACHPPLFSSASLSLRLSLNASLSFSVSCSHSISFSHSPFLSRGAVFWGKSGGVTFWRSWGIIGIVCFLPFSFSNIYSSLPVLCVALNEGRCQGTVCLEMHKSFFEMQNQGENRIDKNGNEVLLQKWYNVPIKSDIITVLEINPIIFTLMNNVLLSHLGLHSQESKD